MNTAGRHQRGLALINALLVVAALSAVAVLLLQRAEGARARQQDTQEVAQAKANLDGFETLLVSLLDADRAKGSADHLKEAWAQENYTVQIGRGQVSGTIRDLQSRFNLNWLVGGDAVVGPEAFKNLLQEMGLRDNLSSAVEDWVSEDGPQNLSSYLNRDTRLAPRGGAIELIEELRLVSGMTPQSFAKLDPVLAVYPAELPINVNTASLAVLQAFMTELPQSTVSALYAERNTKPFETHERLSLWFEQYLSVEDYQNTDVGRFGVSSRWFEAKISATLGKTHMSRRVIFHRSGETGKTRIKFRVTGR